MKARKTQESTQRYTIAYVRVSTDDQAENGVSLDAQTARIAAYCTAMGFPNPEVIRDAGCSAKSLQRPGMGILVERIRRGEIERIIVAKLDRLTRSVRDLADLIELCAKFGTSLVSVGETLDTSSAAGKMVVNMLGVLGQWEREAIGERTASALGHKRNQRTVYGPTPFGFTRDGNRLVPVAREQQALTEALRMDRSGESFRAIGRMLAERGVSPKRGAAWHASSVRAMLRSRICTEAHA